MLLHFLLLLLMLGRQLLLVVRLLFGCLLFLHLLGSGRCLFSGSFLGRWSLSGHFGSLFR